MRRSKAHGLTFIGAGQKSQPDGSRGSLEKWKCAPERIRTSDLRIRSPLLGLTEMLASHNLVRPARKALDILPNSLAVISPASLGISLSLVFRSLKALE
jgi:hypothetical protein